MGGCKQPGGERTGRWQLRGTRVQPKPVQRAAKSFFFSFSQVLCSRLGHCVILLFPITLQGSHESASGPGPLMSGPSLPPPWGEASLLRIRDESSCDGPQASPAPRPHVLPWLHSSQAGRLLERAQGPSQPGKGPYDREQKRTQRPREGKGLPPGRTGN